MQLLDNNPIITPSKDKLYRSPLRYPGGKQRAVTRIAAMFPSDVTEYREPMVGGGSVYLYARSLNIAERYWINDKFRDLVLFWQTVKVREKCEQIRTDLEELRWKYSSATRIKKFFLESRAREPKDDYEAALLFFFFNRVSFSGTTQAGGFSSAASSRRFTQSSIDRLKPMPRALNGTRITNYDFSAVVKKPGKDVFLFLDPPYFTASKLYGRNGTLHNFPHGELAEMLKENRHRHKFLITYDDCEAIREMYRWANLANATINVQEWNLTYGMNNCNRSNTCKVGSELFISNY